jgi:hypothetical protein
MPLEATMRKPFPGVCMYSRIRIIVIEEPWPSDRRPSNRGEECRILRIGDRQPVDCELADHYRVRGALIGWSVIATHRESTRRYAYHIAIDVRGGHDRHGR